MLYKNLYSAIVEQPGGVKHPKLQYTAGYEVVKVYSHGMYTEALRSEEEYDELDTDSDKLLDLTSSKKKLIFMFHPAIAHAMQDSMPFLVGYNVVFPTHEIIIFNYNQTLNEREAKDTNASILDLTIKILQGRGANVRLVDVGDSLLVNKFYLVHTPNNAVYKSANLYKVVEEAIDEIVTPFPDANEKVYISRAKVIPRKNNIEPHENDTLITDDERVTKETELEQVFREMGFEIVYAEDFNSFGAQIEKMRKVKVLAGVSGAGLSNFLFTSSKTKDRTLVEIATPIFLPDPERESQISNFHYIYAEIAWSLECNYVSLSAISDRNGKSIADRIRNSSQFDYLKSL